MPFYSDPTLYSSPLGSYSLYLSGPYSNHSSLIASRTARPNTYVKPLSRFHRGYAPHLSTITENQVNSALRRKYAQSLPLHSSSAKYKVPRPIKINTADIDVSADRYKPRVQAATNLDSAKRKKIESGKDASKSPSPEQVVDVDNFTAKPIRRDRPTVRLRTLHKDEENKKQNLDSPEEKSDDNQFVLTDADSKEAKAPKTVQKNPSFHDICTAILHDSIDTELNPGQSESVKRRQSRTFSNEDFFRQNSDESALKNAFPQERILEDDRLNKEEDKAWQQIDSEENKFDSRGSVKRKKKVNRKKTNESLLSDDEIKCVVPRKAPKKYKRTGTDPSIKSDVPEDLEKDYPESIRDISKVEVEEIKIKPKQLFSATVDVGETIQSKPNLKLIVDDVKVEEVPRTPTKTPKFKLNVTVDVENRDIYTKRKERKLNKTKITDDNRGIVHTPKANGILISHFRHKHQIVSLGDIFEGIQGISKIKADKGKLRKKENCEDQSSIKNNLDLLTKTEDRSSLKKEVVENTDNLVQSHNNCLTDSKITDENKTSEIKNIEEQAKPQIKTEIEEKSEISCQKQVDNIQNSISKDDTELGKDILTDSGSKITLTSEINTSSEAQAKPQISNNEIKEKSEEMRRKEYKVPTLNSKNKLNNIQNDVGKDDKNKSLGIRKTPGWDIKKLNQNIIKPEQNTKSSSNAELIKKAGPSSPEIKCKLPPKEENASSENFWDLIGTRDSVYMQPTNIFKRNAVHVDDPKKASIGEVLNTKRTDEDVKDNVQSVIIKGQTNEILHEDEKVNHEITVSSDMQKDEEQVIPKKMVSKGSLVNKATNDDPDLSIFVVPPELEQEKQPVPQSPESSFTPLQSNRLSQWMHPFKKPEQYDQCPVEIFARPKPIKGRHYPRPKDPLPPPEPTSSTDEESEEESSEEDTDENEATSSENEGIAGKSTSSIDSGFNSTTGSPAMQRNKDCDVNIHRKCEKLTANLCGVNQKLIVEAIESVKKGSSDTRDSPTSNPAHNPAFALDPGDTLEEYYTSSTYASFQKSGRITPPATTIPRFRKYNLEDFNFLKVLGKGSFGKVLLAELKDTEYYYAIKCLKKDVVLEDDDVECTLIERKVLALATKHPYLCHLLCTFQTESHLFFVMEYLNGGDLMFHIQHSGRFPEARARVYGAEIVSGLKFLHSKGIVYRDLKLDNILLDFDGHVRIADFGMCKLQIFLDRMADTFCGTPDYMAPEIIKGLHYNQCVDWWSFGVLLYEMLIGQSPFSGCDEDELFWSICNEKPVLPRFLSAEATSILKQLLEKDANKRLGNKISPHGEIQDHVFFRSILWDLLEKRQLEAPFKPNLQHPLDTQYFDKTFTIEKAKLTPIDKNILQSMDQMQFQGFSYTNPNATDR